MTELSRLVQVPLREVWKHEAHDFTQWLALPENIEYLSDVIGMDIIDTRTEVPVGQYNVDILGEDESGNKIVIENQLEPTNHDHLGKIITYASGLEAKIIVWIVERANQPHEQAIHWLNENTTEDANFFLIQIEAWKIGDSKPAPRFNIIAKPNEWAKTVKQSGSGDIASELKLQQQAFFGKMVEYGEEHTKYVRSWRKPRPQHWHNISAGSSKANFAATVNTREGRVGVELWIPKTKEVFHRLQNKQTEIEADLGFELDWQELPNKKGARIAIYHDGDWTDESQADNLISWLVSTIDDFSRVFPKYL